MSHFSKIKTSLKNLEILKKSLHDLGITYNDKTKTINRCKTQNESINLVIQQNNNYDVGFIWSGIEYQLITDLQFWQQPWPVDVFLDKLTQKYAYNSILRAIENKGFQPIKETTQKNGCIQLTVQRWK
nr:photosystem I assembly protein Ycf35 [Cryptomonas borealis]